MIVVLFVPNCLTLRVQVVNKWCFWCTWGWGFSQNPKGATGGEQNSSAKPQATELWGSLGLGLARASLGLQHKALHESTKCSRCSSFERCRWKEMPPIIATDCMAPTTPGSCVRPCYPRSTGTLPAGAPRPPPAGSWLPTVMKMKDSERAQLSLPSQAPSPAAARWDTASQARKLRTLIRPPWRVIT